VNVTLLEEQGCERTLKVDVTASELQPEFDAAYQSYRKKVKLEGFRKGKAPLHLIKKLYGDAIEAEAMDQIIKSLYPKALDQESIHPIAEGSIEDLQYKPGQDMSFTVKVEVAPKVELQDLSGITLKRETRTVRDENVDSFLEQVRFQQAAREAVEEPAEHGHFVQADVQQLDPNTKLPMVGNKWDDRYFEIGKEVLGAEVDEQLVGVKTGEELKVVRKYPADWAEPSLAGKEEHYQLTIKKVDKLILPELDDELAKDVGGGAETLEDLKTKIREDMEAQAKRDSDDELRRNLLDAVLERHEFDVPSKMVDNVMTSQIEEHKQRSQGQPIDEPQLREQLRPHAERTIKWFWVRKELVEAKDIQVTDEDINTRIVELGKSSNMDEDTAKKIFDNPHTRERLSDDLQETKVVEYLESLAKIEEVWV
jgi:trigger factor